MKKLLYLPVMFLFLISCDKEDPVLLDSIAHISYLATSSARDAQEIKVTINKNSPCQYFSKTEKTVLGNTFNYNFIYLGEGNNCTTQLGIVEVVPVIFDPSREGQYTLNFLINGKLFETRTITVTE